MDMHQDATTRSFDDCYVHKLRLESREGSQLHIESFEAPPRSNSFVSIIAKLFGASLAAVSLLTVAHEVASGTALMTRLNCGPQLLDLFSLCRIG